MMLANEWWVWMSLALALATAEVLIPAWIALGWNAALPGLDGGLYEIVPGFIAAWLAIVVVRKATAQDAVLQGS